MPKLRSYVHVTDDKGYSHVFGPDSDVPDWAVKKIVNPKAWESEGVEPEVEVVEPAPKVLETSPAPKKAPARRARKTEAAED